MIVRSILDDTRIVTNFDYYNDYKDTVLWLKSLPLEHTLKALNALCALTLGYEDYITKEYTIVVSGVVEKLWYQRNGSWREGIFQTWSQDSEDQSLYPVAIVKDVVTGMHHSIHVGYICINKEKPDE